jgi:hypothetical protein
LVSTPCKKETYAKAKVEGSIEEVECMGKTEAKVTAGGN